MMSTQEEPTKPVLWELKKKSSQIPIGPNPTLTEVHEWVQPSHCHQHDNSLRHGHLLRWMDITACLSAEKHAKYPCVTVSVDDITFNCTVSVGHIVILRAVVNRAFSTSMEVGVTVHSENPLTGEKQHVCKAFCVFVSRPKDGSKIKLPLVTSRTEEEQREHLLAGERRLMRITYAKDIEKVVRNLQVEERADSFRKTEGTVHVSETVVQTIQIVLPVHANHHGNTFGGQIMEWMTDIATISALRLSRCQLYLEGIESVHFRGPSHMGERVLIQSCVNKVFSKNRFEVGVRVEGYEVGGEKRHINSAFFIFRPKDEEAVLPLLVTDSMEETRRAANAIARNCLWLDRKAIQFKEHQVVLNSENVYHLILNNTIKLMTNFSLQKWEILPSDSDLVTDSILSLGAYTATRLSTYSEQFQKTAKQSSQAQIFDFEFSKKQSSDNLCLRISQVLEGLSAEDGYKKMSDYGSRPKWDFLCRNTRVFQCITDDDILLHMSYRTIHSSEEIPKDFVVLVSRRRPQEYNRADRKYYLIAYSSVQSPDLPPLKDYKRSHVISSGYILEDIISPDHQKSFKLTYIHQLGSSVMPFFAKDLLGVSTLSEKLAGSLRKFLLCT